MIAVFLSLAWLHCLPSLVSTDCDGVCWFAFDNRDGTLDAQNEMWVQGTNGAQPTGLITISGSFLNNSVEDTDTLRFQKYDTSSADFEPLIFKHDFGNSQTDLNVYGLKNGVSNIYEQTFEDISSDGDFEIKFTTLTSSKMTIQYKDSYNPSAVTMAFDYDDNWSAWGPLTTNSYLYTDRIYSQLKRTKFNYIHICQVESATVCDNGEEDEVPTYDLEEEIVLNCTAVGPAPLTVEWTADVSSTAITSAIDSASTELEASTGTVLTSLLTISSLTVDHLALYTCTVESNGAPALADYQVYTVQYTRAITVASLSDADYITPGSTDESYSWKVTGWPLQDVSLRTSVDADAEEENNSTEEEEDYVLTREEDYSEVPPSVTLTITFNTTISGDSFTVYFVDDEDGKNETVSTAIIKRVGVDCVAGEYGVGVSCVQCDTGYSSLVQSDDEADCFEASSSCEAGYYGLDADCTACPEGKTSTAQSLHLVDCFDYDPNAQGNTGSDSDNMPVIIGGAIGGVLLLILIIAAIFIRCRIFPQPNTRGTLTKPSGAVDMESVVTENPNVKEEISPDADEDLYDNSRLKNTPSTKKPRKPVQDQGLSEINDDDEPAYAELDKEHFDKMNEKKKEKKKKTPTIKDRFADTVTVNATADVEHTTDV